MLCQINVFYKKNTEMKMSNSQKENGGNNFHMSDKILDQIPTPVMAVDTNMNLIYLNDSGQKLLGKEFIEVQGKRCADVFQSTHCNTEDCRMLRAMENGVSESSRNEVTINGKKIPIEYFTAPLKDNDGNTVGGLEYILDITERVKHENRLREQAQTIREISTPAIKLWEGVVVLPVVGVIDTMRAQQMMEKMLDKIVATSAKVIILDISGVAAVDTAVANHLIKITKATKLMGCQCIISGVSPAVAQTIVHLGINMEGIQTNSTLSDALYEAFEYIDLEVHETKSNSRK